LIFSRKGEKQKISNNEYRTGNFEGTRNQERGTKHKPINAGILAEMLLKHKIDLGNSPAKNKNPFTLHFLKNRLEIPHGID